MSVGLAAAGAARPEGGEGENGGVPLRPGIGAAALVVLFLAGYVLLDRVSFISIRSKPSTSPRATRRRPSAWCCC